MDDEAPSPVWHAPAVPTELADVSPALALPPVATVPAELQSWAEALVVADTHTRANMTRSLSISLSPYFADLVIEQVPSDRFVTTEPSGRTVLAVEKLSALPDPVEELDADDVVVLDEVLLPVVVDELTLPLPAVTDVDMPSAGERSFITVQIVPSSRVMFSDDA